MDSRHPYNATLALAAATDVGHFGLTAKIFPPNLAKRNHIRQNMTMNETQKSINLSVVVEGNIETIWRAISTGPGISSWYVPHQVEGRAGGAATASFGPEPEMQITGRVAAYEPPHRIVFDGGEGVDGLSFEWLVASNPNNTCTVTLNNTGFTKDDPQFEPMIEGWKLFMFNLQLHLKHFAGQTATSALPMGMWQVTVEEGWKILTKGLGITQMPAKGDHIEFSVDGRAHMSGTVVDVGAHKIVFLVESPAKGTAFLTSEAGGPMAMVSMWLYLYGEDGALVVANNEAHLRQWLNDQNPAS